ncbi:DUF6473 family protein [Cognatishimia maritima]|uniref:DUF6473 domain-containing protein n=1 Tax=Cognatishimia maritima TaxID=870908 RepID=A0A1M5MVP8_9RHOB|nr:DUF6473 family protein [Cognatishimia maritima]SHG81287.1 hypothetical protein SAMN04488044_1347 [Cognatishimia maritima]
MTLQKSGQRPLDYCPCRYGSTRVDFRGPKKSLNGRYIAFLGGSETYGKYIRQPFSALVEESIGLPCPNFGLMNAGVDVFLNEPEILAYAGRAEVTVLQVVGAQNMSNRFYSVHPRRNDRFVKASDLMQSVFHDIDFSEFNFTRHMLQELSVRAEDRFAFVREELRNAWCARMQRLLDRIPGHKILLWFANNPPPRRTQRSALGKEPLFVDHKMIDGLRPFVSSIVNVQLSKAARTAGTKGMVFRDLDEPAAKLMPGPRAHAEVAAALVDEIRPLVGDIDLTFAKEH